VYFDFKVQHQQLLQKLSSSGITGRTHQWIKSWLSGRKQRVVLNGQYSSEISVTSSVPQGSVLGPTLFLVFINDLTEKIQLPNYLYADDTKIIGLTATIADKRRLQDDIVLFLYSWKGGNGFSTRMVPKLQITSAVAKPRVICNLGIISVENPIPPIQLCRSIITITIVRGE
jgi:hypothetical protein